MRSTNFIFAGTLVLAICLFCTACPEQGKQNLKVASNKPTATKQPGIDFTKVTVGLPSNTLDYIGEMPNGLAGARPAQQVFFSVREGTSADIYRRDLASGQREKVYTADRLIRGSLIASSDGKTLVYCRAWEIAKYIDDPTFKDPAGVAVIMKLDVGSGASEEVFNFRDPQWQKYRADAYAPMISADGSTIIALGYDFDQVRLAQHLNDWVAYFDDYLKRKSILAQPDIEERLKVMRDLTLDERVKPKLQELGITPSTTGEIPTAEREAMRKLAQAANKLDAALLLWQAGQTSVLPLQFPAATQGKFHYILAAGTKTLLLGAQRPEDNAVQPQTVYRCDLLSGQVTEFTTIPGPPSSLQLNADETELMAVYNPFDAAKKEVLAESHLRRIPLAGGEPVDITLPHDFLGYTDLLTDGSLVAGQDQDDQSLCLVDIESGTSKKLAQLLGPVDGLFLAGTGESLAYLEKGLLFAIDIPADPQQSPAWRGEEYFADTQQAMKTWLTGIGITLPPTAQFRWEERDGMGAHEVAADIHDPAKPEQPVILRYDAEAQQVSSIWFPRGCVFPVAADMTGKDLDYYGCKEIADKALERAGWLPGDTAQIFQPGPNPLYDAKSNSYILTYRDGYWLGKGEGAKWVFDKEATLRVIASNGHLAEMTLLIYQPVVGQPETIDYERAVYLIRNEGTMKIEEKMPVRFDTENVRLVVVPKYSQNRGPALYNEKPSYRLCYEIDAYLTPEDELILTSRVDTETGELMGQLDFMPSNIPLVQGE